MFCKTVTHMSIGRRWAKFKFKVLTWINTIKIVLLGCRHSSVDSSAPTILQSRVWVPSALLCFYNQIVMCKERNKQKRGRVWPIKKLWCFQEFPKRQNFLNGLITYTYSQKTVRKTLIKYSFDIINQIF